MKRYFLIPLLTVPILLLPVTAAGQVVNYAKTLPVRSFSVGVSPSWHFNKDGVSGLRNQGVDVSEPGTFSAALTGGYSLNYSMDLGARYMYTHGGKHYFGVDLQYLIHEARQSYFSVVAGLHRWEGYGVDLTGLFTWSPRYFLNLTVGLDVDVDYYPEDDDAEIDMPSVAPKFWVPVNIGFNANDVLILFLEYEIWVSNWAWSVASLGVNVVIR